jgi:HK97 family phage portal protein
MTLRDRITAALQALRGGAMPGVSNAVQDHPNGTLTADDMLSMGIFGGGRTFGPAVTDSSALQVGTVYACLAKLAGAVSQLPLHEYRYTQASRERIQPNSPLWWLLNESPSPAWTATAWKQWIVRCVKLRGDQHTEILRRGSEAVGFKVHHPDYVVTTLKDGRLNYSCRDFETGEVYGVDQDDMLHFTGFGFDGLRSMSAIKWAARNAIAAELGAAQYIGKTITEGGMPRVALEYPAGLSPDQAAALRTSFAAIYGGGEGGKLPLVLANGGKAHELSISPVDLELLASRRMDKQTICEVMGVPPIIIGDSEKTSSWGTGVEQITLGWVRFDVQPMLAGWEEELNRKLYRRAGRFLEFSLAALLRGDSKAQADAFRAALGGPGTGDGWMSVDEVRGLLNLSPLGGEHTKPFRAQRGTTTPKDPAP